MGNIINRLIILLIWGFLKLRYRVKVKGLEKLNSDSLKKPGGILFLTSHPATIDPVISSLILYPKYTVRPLITDYMYNLPVVRRLMVYIRAIPVPTFDVTNIQSKRIAFKKSFKKIVKDVKRGDHFIISPAGQLKDTGKETIGGASGVHAMIKEVPECNVVLVRIKGLWGSSFSRYYTKRTPPLYPSLYKALKIALCNLIFFTPRRQVIVELEPAPKNFPWESEKDEFNRWLENWYNQPDGLSEQEGEYPGDSLILISYSMWRNRQLPVQEDGREDIYRIDMDNVPGDIQNKIYQKIGEIAECDPCKLRPNTELSNDLLMDSIEIVELVEFIKKEFHIAGDPAIHINTVEKALGFATGQIECVAKSS